jgi:hypothetical protein
MLSQGFLLMEDMIQNHPQPDHTILEHIIFGCGLRGHWNRARKLLTTMPTRRSLKLTPTVSKCLTVSNVDTIHLIKRLMVYTTAVYSECC